MHSIRAHITAWAFAVFAALVVVQGALLLGALDRGLLRLADAGLRDELERLVAESADVGLGELLGQEGPPDGNWSDLVFELRDALERRRRGADPQEALLYAIRHEGGAWVASSEGGAGFSAHGPGAAAAGLRFRDAADPRMQGARLRVAELALGPYRLELARSLSPLERIESAVRSELALILLGICTVGVLGAFLIATRALAPVKRLAAEAERLRTLSEGSLPRSGRGDEIDELARILNDLLARSRAEMLRMRQFTADAAHEIRTPLAAIRGHLELLLPRLDADSRSTLESVLEEADRLTRLVNRLLLLEKLEGGASASGLEERRVDLGGLARELSDHLQVLARERGIDLCCRVAEAPVRGDPEKLRQIFLNLLDNAFAHTPRGGSVSLRVERLGDRVRAQVLDTGAGIPQERLERIFDRFSSDRSRRNAGTGLGLPIARAIARAHGGELRAASPGGAEFTLELPMREF